MSAICVNCPESYGFGQLLKAADIVLNTCDLQSQHPECLSGRLHAVRWDSYCPGQITW